MQYKKIILSFDSAWILSKRGDEVLPVAAFLTLLGERFDLAVLGESLTDCEAIIKNIPADEQEIRDTVSEILQNKFDLDITAGGVSLSILDADTAALKADEKQPEGEAKPEREEAPPPESGKPAAATARINALIGVEEFKALAEECVRIAPGIKKYQTFEAFRHQSYIFSVNAGNGLSTCLKLFVQLLSELGLFAFSAKDAVVEERLPPPGKDGGGNPFSAVLAHFGGYTKSSGKLICIDISDWMTKTAEPVFRDFLAVLEDRIGENLVVFRVPFVEKEILTGLKRSLGDMLFIREVSFIPFSAPELMECASKTLQTLGFSMEDEAWEVFDARLTEEKMDGKFYGINTVNKVIREMIYRKLLDNAASGVDDTLIKKREIADLCLYFQESEKSGFALLDEFVGMEPIKKRIEEIVAQIEMSTRNSKLGPPCIHMRFIGNPGTGKTTVARVIGKILKEKGILRNGSFFEYAGRDFCGRYVGETAPKTAAMCRDAYGSVMFIDEAYSLYRGEGHSTVDYGREAIDTLIAEMENHRSDLVVIMAGYPDDMEALMKGNAGLESRMPYIIDFPNYTRDELYRIFVGMAQNSFCFDCGFEEAVKAYFDSLPDEVITSKEFSNARFVRNLFERTWGKAVLRAQFTKGADNRLIKEDFLLASAENEFQKIMKKKNRALGFL